MMRKLIIAAAVIAAVFTITAPAHATNCTDVTIPLGQPYWITNGTPGAYVELGTFDTSTVAGFEVTPTVYNFASVRSDTTAHIGPVTILDAESQPSKSGAPFVAGASIVIAVTLSPTDGRQSIDQVSLTCPTPPDTTSTTTTQAPTSTQPGTSTSTSSTPPASTTIATTTTSTSSTSPSSTSSTSSVPAGTTTTSSPPDGTTTTVAPSSTVTSTPESSTTKAPSSSHPSTTVQPTLPPTGPGDFLPWLVWAGAVCIVAGVWLVRRAS